MRILGIHFHSHDSTIFLTKNKKVEFAVSEERFSRKKLDARPPFRALKQITTYTGVTFNDIDEVVLIGMPFIKQLRQSIHEVSWSLRLTKGKYLLMLAKPWLIIKQLIVSTGIPTFLFKHAFPELRIRLFLKINGFNGKISYVHHHMAHLYSAYYTSGWKNCLVACCEGSGFDETFSIYKVTGNNWKLINTSSIPHSAGRFYELITLLLGYDRIKHPGKITGLAAYGNWKKPHRIVSKLLYIENDKLRLNYSLYLQWQAHYYKTQSLPLELAKYSKEDLAASFQKRLEECITQLIDSAALETKVNRIALAGGVFANVKLNQRIHELKSIKSVHIHQAMGDSGLAAGGVLRRLDERGIQTGKYPTVYWGPSFKEKEIRSALKNHNVNSKRFNNIEKEIARLLADSKVVARFTGNMEYGPRALGNRSILYNTKDKTVNEWLNKHLKRTEFMPFAPITMQSYANKCYKRIKGAEYPARFMTICFDCTAYMKQKSPAVVHIDGTARPQLVRQSDNASLHKVLNEYYKLTKTPSLINTSFNMHGEPIVCTPEDAIRSFLAGNLDYLALGNYLVTKNKYGSKSI